MYRAKLQYAFLLSLTQKPFGSREWAGVIKGMLDSFQLRECATGKWCRKYFPLWARDRKPRMRCETSEDFEALFDDLVNLRWCQHVNEAPKVMRWFAINNINFEVSARFLSTKLKTHENIKQNYFRKIVEVF